MTTTAPPYHIFPLGDSALIIDYGNRIDDGIHSEVMARFHDLKENPLPGMRDVLPAYSAVIVHYDPLLLRKSIPAGETVFGFLSNEAARRLQKPVEHTASNRRLIKIPVCYDALVAPDIAALAAANHLSTEEVISIHTSVTYKVYMLGFMPGFPYMGNVDEKIALPRKQRPVNVAAGSVGIAGRQTGIYPFASPGGWQIIGRTAPGSLFNKQHTAPEGLTLLQPGDLVQFYSIGKEELEALDTAC